MAKTKRFVTSQEMYDFRRFGDTTLMPDPEEIARRAYNRGLSDGGGGGYTKKEIDEMLANKVTRADIEPIISADLPENYQIEDVKRRLDDLLRVLRTGHL